MINRLKEINQVRRTEIELFCSRKKTIKSSGSPHYYSDYSLPNLKEQIVAALSARWGQGRLEIQLESIDRERFGGDFSLKIPQLLAEGGPKTFIREHLPWIVEVLSCREFEEVIRKLETKGMYINLTISDGWFMKGVHGIIDRKGEYGTSDTLANRRIVVDYSSPNVAKVLHAGHIRSTIIGHVLCNLYGACGAQVFRINHINDFGGFGFMLEGFRRFKQYFPRDHTGNQILLEIYAIRRTLERIVEKQSLLSELEPADRLLLARYFPEVVNDEQLASAFEDFLTRSGQRFEALESGDSDEVELWKRMVEWSLADFDSFYKALNIRFDLVMGESFYHQAGNEIVEECLQRGTAIVFTDDVAGRELAELHNEFKNCHITASEHDVNAKSIRKDIGAVVVPLGKNDRYVIRRADGRSIYSTRDLGAIKLRQEFFEPTHIVYVVGQEQKAHFDRLFRTAYRVGLADPTVLRFSHVYFGFYVDATTRKKLSSRDMVANVNQLLDKSFAYFRQRLSGRVDQSQTEIEKSAHQLSVGSLVFNDLAQDLKGEVSIEIGNIDATIERFEKSGGAYVVYTCCRAKAILRKHEQGFPRREDTPLESLDNHEVALISGLLQFPEKILESAKEDNPSILVRYVLDIAALYNSYYHRAEVISANHVNMQRLLITGAVEQTLRNALQICHVECPEAI